MTTTDVIAMTRDYLLQTYRQAPVAFSHGQGVWLYDLEGRRYLDFIGGIAVSVLGHAHPKLVAAIQAQAARLLHVSNLFHIAEQATLARWLVEHSALDRAFFCNSGAEANEAAIKLARKWGRRDGRDRYEIIVMHRSFHGRTMGTLAATMQPKYQQPFTPLPPGFVAVPFDDLDAVRAATTGRTCAVLVEPVGSVWGGGPPGPHKVEGIGNSFWPATLERSLVDEIRTVSDDDSLALVKELARREALLRMREEARELGASYVFNVKMETSSISKGRRDSIGSVEVLAYGTAVILAPAVGGAAKE